jgi:hypothetical protein
MSASVETAIAHCAHQSAHGPRFGTGECQRQTRRAYQVESNGTPDASTDWSLSEYQHRPPADLRTIPRGALLAWTGGTHGHGHRAICAGNGLMWSTDSRRPGYYDLVPIEEPAKRWGLKFVGWTEDIDGVHVFTPPHPHPLVKAAVHAEPGDERRAAMQRLAENGPPRLAAKARVWLKADQDKHRILTDLHRVVTP